MRRHFTNADNTFNVAAIMKAAHFAARNLNPSAKAKWGETYAQTFAFQLKSAWNRAKGEQAIPAQIAHYERMADLAVAGGRAAEWDETLIRMAA